MVERDPQLFPPGFETWMQVVKVYQRSGRVFAEWLRPLELTVPQHELLANLYHEDNITQQELARRLLVSKGNITGLINRLSAQDLVKRVACEEDARSNRIHLTLAGRKLAKKALELQADFVTKLMAAMSQTEQESMFEVMKRVQERVEELRTSS